MRNLPSALDPHFRAMYYGGRRSGRTSKLIRSAPLNCIIVCATSNQARYVQQLAVDRGRADLKCISASFNTVYRAHDDIMRFNRGTKCGVAFDHFWVERFFGAGNSSTALQWLEYSINACFYSHRSRFGTLKDDSLATLVDLLSKKERNEYF